MNYKEYACSTLLAFAMAFPAFSYVNPVYAASAESSEKDPTFVVSEFKVEGPVLIPRAEIEKMLALYANRPLTFSDLREATVKVEKLHADAGFEVVRAIIPEQDLTPGGTLTIQIVDARLDAVKVNGNEHFSSDQIRRSLVVLSPGALINTMDMDKNLRVLNDNPAISARVTLEPSDKPALVDAQVKVQDQNPLGAYVTFDNTGTQATGRYRLGLVVIDNNVFGLGHMLSAQTVTSPGRWSDVEVYGLNYRIPFFAQNGILDLTYNDSNVNAGTFSVGSSSLNVQGAGTTAGIKWTQFLNRLSGMDQRLFFSFDHKQFTSQVLLNNSGSSLTPDLQSDPYTIGYSLLDQRNALSRQLQLTYSKNYVMGGQNSTAQYAKSNSQSKADFDVLRLNSSWSDQIFSRFRFTAALDGQYSSYSLISGEQFGAGGVYSVRGFEERAVSGDSGLRESFELLSPNVLSDKSPYLKRLQYAAFVEGAQLRSNAVTPPTPSETRILSAGVGLRFALTARDQVRLDLARVVSGTVVEPHGDMKLHLSIAVAL